MPYSAKPTLSEQSLDIESFPLLPRPYPACSSNPRQLPTPSVFVATIKVTTKRIARPTAAPTVTRWLLDTLHICVSEPDVPFASVGDIPTELAQAESAQIAINLGILQMTVHFLTLPRNRQPMSSETVPPYEVLRERSVDLEPGARVYERGNVTIDYLSGSSFLLCYSYRRMFPLGLCQYLENRYVFSLGPQTFSLAPFPQDAPTPVPLLLFSS